MNYRTAMYALAGIALLMFVLIKPAISSPLNQTDPTSFQETLDRIVQPRQTQTALGYQIQTQTAISQATGTAHTGQTQTIIATLTAASPTPNWTATTTLTLNPTQQMETVVADVKRGFTQTVQVAAAQSETARYNATIQSALNMTQTAGATVMSSTPTLSATPSLTVSPTRTLSAPEHTQTANAIIKEGVQQTGTAAAAATLDLYKSLTLTALIPTPNATQARQTLNANAERSLTQTLQAQVAFTATAYFLQVVGGLSGQNQTATAQVYRSTLVSGLSPITVDSAARLTLLKTLSGQMGPVRKVVFSHDGLRMASVGADNTIRLWDVQAGTVLNTLKGDTDRLSVAFSPDGTTLAAVSSDKTVRLWDAVTGDETKILKGHTGSVLSVAFSPDSTLLATGSADRTVRVWNIKGQGDALLLKAHQGSVQSVAFSPDGKKLASGSQDTTIILWEVNSGVQLATLRGHYGTVSDLAFNSDGSMLASASGDGTVRLWFLATNDKPVSLRAKEQPTAGLTAVTLSPDGTCVAAVGHDGVVVVWNTKTNAQLVAFKVKDPTPAGTTTPPAREQIPPVNSLAFSPDGVRLVTAGDDSKIRLWGIPGGS